MYHDARVKSTGRIVKSQAPLISGSALVTGTKLKNNYGIAASMHSNGSRRLSRLSRLEREAALTVARTSRRWSPHASSSRRSARRHG